MSSDCIGIAINSILLSDYQADVSSPIIFGPEMHSPLKLEEPK